MFNNRNNWFFLLTASIVIMNGCSLGEPKKEEKATIKATAKSQTTVSESKSDPKTQLLYKMRDTVDTFTTVKGNFVESSKRDGESNVEFVVQEGDHPESYVKSTSKDRRTEDIYTGKYFASKVNGTFAHIAHAAPPGPNKFNKKSPLVLEKMPDGSKLYNTRPDHAQTGRAEAIVAPLTYAIGYLENQEKWSFQPDERLLGREVTVVSGELSDYFKEKHQAETFKYWIDKQTGMVLKRETYDKQGKIVDKLEVKNLEINVPINTSLFNIPQNIIKSIY
ncbi:hypothetical protein BIV60_12225 [Bacillus sp. MUM 116]|uniref:sigma-E factor regulatory protein RseB domain-containing protein n=1 Tax=Bacillus sp. MUM 116 TaxID=1678002 RepID=UPI0008F5F547|nr:sigma-E factor regulatory protein RseB domain-containing protein [Bacillus sp. MUM 116]OIK14265.1 hypothetical protein BIV60_12225 [Bacillus sp. MUM 116]